MWLATVSDLADEVDWILYGNRSTGVAGHGVYVSFLIMLGLVLPLGTLKESQSVPRLPRILFPSERLACINFVEKSADQGKNIRTPVSMQIICFIHQIETSLRTTSIKGQNTHPLDSKYKYNSRYSLGTNNQISELPFLKLGGWFWEVRNRGGMRLDPNTFTFSSRGGKTPYWLPDDVLRYGSSNWQIWRACNLACYVLHQKH
jgi:hypothetical protein